MEIFFSSKVSYENHRCGSPHGKSRVAVLLGWSNFVGVILRMRLSGKISLLQSTEIAVGVLPMGERKKRFLLRGGSTKNHSLRTDRSNGGFLSRMVRSGKRHYLYLLRSRDAHLGGWRYTARFWRCEAINKNRGVW